MGLAAKLYRDDRAERRAVVLDATLRDPSLQPIDVEVADLSVTGFRARCGADLPEGSKVSLGLAGLGVQEATVVRRDGDSYGCEFAEPLATSDIERALRAVTVVDGSFAPLPNPGAAPEPPRADTLPFAVRAVMILGISGLLWGVIGAGIYAVAA